ncbi:hypothetical protein BJV74DRAFT_887094 [Russula compacta]|nr:hypothetical protein BJV74DRAFT_887094 [Russula compacta]
MSEKSMKQKVLRAARRVLSGDAQWIEIPNSRNNHIAGLSSRSYTFPQATRFPTPRPNGLRRPIPEQRTQPTVTKNHDIFLFRFSDLPLELLQQIFLFSPEWLPITQVCRSWRTVAHTYPLLWSIITPNLNIFWVDIMQQRSKPLLLDVHLRVGRRDIDDRQVTMTTYAALIILRNISPRMRSLRLDGPRDQVQNILTSLHKPSPLLFLAINIPLWDLGTPFSIPSSVFSFQAPVRSLSFSADRALRAPGWLLQGLTSFKTCGKVPLQDLLGALRQMPFLEHFTLLKCTAVWTEPDVNPAAVIPMDRLEEFVVRSESPRHFVLLAMRLAMPEAVRKRLVVHMLAAPGWGFWARWLEALPPLYAAHTRGGLQHIRISGGPTRGRFLAWTDDGPHADLARFCFELEWNGSPPAPDGVRAIELTSPFYRLHTLCDELNAADVRRVLVEGDPAHIVVAEGYWHQFMARLLSVEELWLYPGTAEVLWSACAPRDAPAEPVLRTLRRVYVVGGRLSAPKVPGPATASGSDIGGPLAMMKWNVSSSLPPPLPPKDHTRRVEAGIKNREESHGLDVTPGLMALLRGGADQSREVHLRNCEVENGALAPLCALAKVRRNYDWILTDT